MVQLTLPKNSQMRTGKTWPKPETGGNLRKFRSTAGHPMMTTTRAWTRISSIWTIAGRWCWTR